MMGQSAHVLLNLLDKVRKRQTVRLLSSILSLFAMGLINSTKQKRTLNFIHHMKLKLLLNHAFA